MTWLRRGVLGRLNRRTPRAAGPVRPVMEDADGPVTFADLGDPTPAERRRYAAAVSARRFPILSPERQVEVEGVRRRWQEQFPALAAAEERRHERRG